MTAAYGVEGFTEDHRAALRQYGTERVYIAYDRDEAGDRAAAKLAEELAAMGIEVLRVKFPKGIGRERIRTEGAARGAELGAGAAASGVDGGGAGQGGDADAGASSERTRAAACATARAMMWRRPRRRARRLLRSWSPQRQRPNLWLRQRPNPCPR